MNSEFWPDLDYKTVGKLILEDGSEYVGYSVGYEGRQNCVVPADTNGTRVSSFSVNEKIKNPGLGEAVASKNDDVMFYNSKIETEDFIVSGEVIFNTAMVGYVEALTDPSYFGQILVMTFPSIGNYGVPKVKHGNKFGLVQNFESNRIQIQGLIICEYSKEATLYNSDDTLSGWLKFYGVPCIGGIDTRALTKKLREKGSMLGKIVIYKNRSNITKLYQEIPLFDPGEIDTIKYVCNHYIRVFKLTDVQSCSKKNCLGGDDERANVLGNADITSTSCRERTEDKEATNSTSSSEQIERNKMNLLLCSSDEILRDLYCETDDMSDDFSSLTFACEHDKYLIDIEEHEKFHMGNIDEYGYYDVKKAVKRENAEIIVEDQRKRMFNLNHDNSDYVKQKMKNEEFLTFVNKRLPNVNEKKVVIVDCGMKNSILKKLLEKAHNLPITYIVVPYYYDYNLINYDAVLLSNGPGDPKKCDRLVETLRTSLQKNKIIFGICLGNQLLGLALGCETYKMKYGNRGVNQPVIHLTNNKCYITSQNHGYCLKKKSILKKKELYISFVNANDKTVEGISHKNGRFYSVQYHPEGNNGPDDTSFLFKKFLLDIFNKKKEHHENIGYNIIYIKKKVLLLGSGGLCIGQAGEFDYSGTQAIKSLKECGIYVILVNPNIATVQTSKGLADKVYFLPVNCEFVEKIIKKEKPDFLLCTFGGQTALNCALTLEKKKILKKYNCIALGTSLDSILVTENRSLFAEKLKEINEITAPYGSARNLEEALKVANRIGYPVLIRTTFSLGGLNSSFINDEKELIQKCEEIFLQTDNEIFIDKSLKGWKEIEYELLRDNKNNCIAICNMENVDPLGIHTGDSIVVAPSQTLNNHEYYKFREIALKVIRHLNIIGECNIQFGLNPKTGEYCIIEVNARLSRSSALASKATGYPLAYISAKLALGYDLINLKNSITRKTTACFEPSLDFIITKIPRWDLNKFEFASNTMNSSMKSVGEVMAIGRTFEESIQKSLRCIDDNYLGFTNTYCVDWSEQKIIEELKNPSPKRIDAIHQAFHLNIPIEKINELTNIDFWFLHKFYNIYNLQNKLKTMKLWDMDYNDLKYFKKHGFSDKQLAYYLSFNEKVSEMDVQSYREELGLHPHIKVIDTVSAEFPALTNYLYLTYQGVEHDVLPLNIRRKKEAQGKNEKRERTHAYAERSKGKRECRLSLDMSLEQMNVMKEKLTFEGEITENEINKTGVKLDEEVNYTTDKMRKKNVEGIIQNTESMDTNVMSEENSLDRECNREIRQDIGSVEQEQSNANPNNVMDKPPSVKQNVCKRNSESSIYNKKSPVGNTNGKTSEMGHEEANDSRRTSSSTNDQFYLENIHTSEDEGGNKSGLASMRSIGNGKNAEPYYVIDSVYNTEYKYSKMQEMIRKESREHTEKHVGQNEKTNYEVNGMLSDNNEATNQEKRKEERKTGFCVKSCTKKSGKYREQQITDTLGNDFSQPSSKITDGDNKRDYDVHSYTCSNGYSSYSDEDSFNESDMLRSCDESEEGGSENEVEEYTSDDVSSSYSDNSGVENRSTSAGSHAFSDSDGKNIFYDRNSGIGFKIIDNKEEKEKHIKKCFMVLGCGCYRIGSSVEFDWSAIHCVKTIRKLNHKAILINCNPETVSTDYDESDRLYFDEISTEVIKFIYNFENSHGVIIAFGGQTSNNLVFSLYNNNVKILGSSPQSVDCCENRNKFSHLCDSLKIDQPKWNKFTKLSKAIQFSNEVKFPVLVRPSYVLSGAAMRVVTCFEELKNFLMKAAIVSKDNPVVITKFIENAKEIEIDCISKNGKIINYAISEHVENAGVHSGDATLILPAQNIYVETHRKIKKISEKISKALNISGPFNIQFLCHQNEIKIIECNLRASRTFPFISKALNLNFIDLATRILIGYDVKPINISLIDLEYTAVKSPIFSFNRLHGSDCILGVEMKSTGEVACFGLNKYEALLKSLVATGMKLPKKYILISIKNLNNKLAFEEPFQLLFLMGFTIYATEGTYEFYSKFLETFSIKKGTKFHQRLVKVPNKNAENNELPNTNDLIMHHKVEMVINITDTIQTKVGSNGYKIRRLASDFQVPLITNMKLASLFIDSLYRKFSKRKQNKTFYTIKSYDEYINMG